MPNANTINVQLTVNDDGSVVMKQFGQNSEDALNKVTTASPKATSALDSLKSSYIDCAAKAATAYMAISKAMEYMDLGAKAAQGEASFRTLSASAGESADGILAAMKKATDGTISDSEMMQKAGKAMLLGFSGDQIEQMGEMARLAARTSGETVADTFSNIVDAISTNMPRTLKQYGLVTKDQFSMVTQAMAEGVTDINLYSLAQDNMNVQLAKTGPLLENEAEKLQQKRAELQKIKEETGDVITTAEGYGVKVTSAITEPLMALGASAVNSGFFGFDLGPIEAYIDKLTGVEDETKKVATANLAAAQAKKAQDDAYMKVELGKVAQKKAQLETMKALDKDYFTSQEANIKATAEFLIACGADEYKTKYDAMIKSEAMYAEEYQVAKQEIEKAADARQKAEKDKVSDAVFTAQKMQELDAATTNKKIVLIEQERQLAIQTAQTDIKNLTSRLADYQKYYDSLKAMMDKNVADEKQHQTELKALQTQYTANQTSSSALITQITGSNKNMTAQQTYETGRSDLNQQYMDITNTMTGQDQIAALEKYKQAVAALQQQFAQGIQGPKDIFGNPQDIISAAKISEDAISDINLATQTEQSTIAALIDQKKQQIATDQLWGQMLSASLTDAQTQMDKLKATISDLSDQIKNMQKTVELTGIDKVSSVVDSIMARIQQLHTMAAQPITLDAVLGGSGGASAIPSLPTNPFSNGGDLAAEVAIDSFAVGTDYVPRTGLYQLHQGEAVVPAKQNGKTGATFTGDINIVIPASAAAQSAADWRAITRNYIVPELRKLSS